MKVQKIAGTIFFGTRLYGPKGNFESQPLFKGKLTRTVEIARWVFAPTVK